MISTVKTWKTFQHFAKYWHNVYSSGHAYVARFKVIFQLDLDHTGVSVFLSRS